MTDKEFYLDFHDGYSVNLKASDISEESRTALCRALLELQGAYELLLKVDRYGDNPYAAIKSIVTDIANAMDNISNDENTEKIQTTIAGIMDADLEAMSPDDAYIMRMRVETIYNQLHDNQHFEQCTDGLLDIDDLLMLAYNTCNRPLLRVQCGLRIAADDLARVKGLSARDAHCVGEISKFLSVLPGLKLIYKAGKGRNLQRAILKAANNLADTMARYLDEETYRRISDEQYFFYFFFFQTDEYKIAAKKELNKS